MLMHARAIVLIVLVSLCIVSPIMATSEERYGYITVQDVNIQLDNGTARINVNYTVDEGTTFFFFLLGKQDLKTKLMKILNYDDAQITRIDLTSAEFTVPSAAHSYGNGVYWYPSHDFNVAIPALFVHSPQVTQNFTMAKQFPGGMGYFANPPSRPEPPLPEVPDAGH